MKHLLKTLLFAALSLFSAIAYAQGEYTVSGVVSNERGEPVKSATVFIGGSQRVTPTDDNGRFSFAKVPQGTFQLSVQMLGYAPLVQNIIVKDAPVKVDLKLSPKTINLAQVTIGNNKAWEENYNVFKATFLGTTANGKQCVIINPQVLNFTTRQGFLYADTDDFLIIENKRLGYRIKYMLKHFSYNKTDRVELHDGEFTFEELEGTFAMQDYWAKNRLQAYQGSFRHFLRSVYANTVLENGFLARPMYGYRRFAVNNRMVDPDRVIVTDSPIKFDSLISALDTSLTSFKFKQMLVTYDPKKAMKFAAKKPTTARTSMYLSSDESILVLSNDQAIIDSRGSYVDYKSFFITGKWGALRVGDQLPIEYKPPMPEIPRKNVPTNQLLASLHNWTDSLPQEKLYLHMDKPYYAQGDTMWFKGYLTSGADHQLSPLSGAAYVELVDDQAQLVKRLKLPVNQGTISGDLVLTDTVRAGNYRVRAYTQWMRNAGEDYFFDKSITIGNPPDDKNKTTPKSVAKVNLQQTDIQFFPEGGNLLIGAATKVGFKATGTNGLGVTISGYVTDNDNKKVAIIETLHAGMGNFLLLPEAGKTYTAHVKFADSTTKSIVLPTALKEGYALSVNQTSADSILLRVYASPLLQPSNVNLIAHSSGQVLFASPIAIKGAITKIWLNKSLFPTGITQVTLFNDKYEPLNERITFIKNADLMQLTIDADSGLYKRRSHVQIRLNATDSKRIPVEGNFSVAVIDESKVPVDETVESTILSHLLLTSDIKGYIERPNYYFTAQSDSTLVDRALDNLMLTQGYRRFNWTNLNVVNTPPAFAAEKKGMAISGLVTNLQKDPVKGASVLLVSLNAGMNMVAVTDANGRFKFDELVFADSARVAIQAKLPDSNLEAIIKIDTLPTIAITRKYDLADAHIIKQNLQKAADEGKPAKLTGLHTLDEVQIKSVKKIEDENKDVMQQGVLTQRDISVDKVLRIENPEMYNTVGEFLMARVPGVSVETGPKGVTGLVDMRPSLSVSSANPESRAIIVFVNGSNGGYDIDDMLNGRVFTVEDVDRVQIVRTSLAAKSRMMTNTDNPSPAGYINIILKHPSQRKQYNPAIANIMPKGYNKMREFYSPKYDNPKVNEKIPDLRTTIYWNPYINTDANGETKFDFYNGDGAGTYRVVVEGINAEGELGRQVYRYKVE